MQPKQGHLSGTFSNDKSKIDVKIPIIEFEEDGCNVVYCPALDVSGYGKTESEASQSFTISLSAFFQYSINKNTFVDEMHRMGWKFKNIHKRMIPPDMSKLLSENENFSRIFNNHSFRKYDKSIEIPIA
jgi:hypothetical protein